MKFLYFACILATILARDIRVFHMTDIHAELDYLQGAATPCEKGPCCRATSVPVNGTYPAPKYGDHKCDNAPDFIRDSFKYFANLFEENPDLKPDYIMMTGDQCTHRPWETQTAEMNIRLVRYVHNTYREYFRDYTTIPVMGNHDTYPEGHMKLPPENRWMTEVMAEMWKGWVPEEQMENVLYGGYYTMLVGIDFFLLSLDCQEVESNRFEQSVVLSNKQGG